jgi:hypothetical protein
MDKLDGTGPSLLSLNLDNPQIMFIDVEWLGVGSIRMGFVINGELIHCHTFHHSNLSISPKGAYMQTACLTIRSEIENIGTTSGSSTFKQICCSVISEGGYELTGRPRSIGQDPSNSVVMTTAGTYYPILSIRLNPAYLDGVVVPKEVDFLPINSANYRIKIVKDATIAGAVWANVASDSIVQYNTNATATASGGTTLNSAYITSTVQAAGSINLAGDLFKYQLERNSFTNTASTFTVMATSGTSTSNSCASITWEELT